jgi:hypothetical protein
MKIALTIPTGRPIIKKVVKAFIENAISHGYNPKDISVYLSIDKEYENTKLSEFKLDPRIEKKVKKVIYISERKRQKIAERIKEKCNANPKIVEALFMGRGYSKQRNAALFLALIDKNDFAICFDDDETPFIPIKKEKGNIYWKNLDFFTPHIKELSSGTDITIGPIIGYRSPVPSDFDKDIPEEIKTKLGEALKWGSDVVTKYYFLNLISQIKYLEEKTLENTDSILVEQEENGKRIWAGNMAINLNSVRKGRIPIFFTPPEARGEDSIFSLQLQNVTVKEVRSYIFHDPFQMYPEIFNGKFPEILKSIPITKQSKQRFASALIGWLKYAPILIELTSKTNKEKQEKVEKMLNNIEEPTQELAELLNLPELRGCKSILKKYYKEVQNHHNHLLVIQNEWKNKIIPSIV